MGASAIVVLCVKENKPTKIITMPKKVQSKAKKMSDIKKIVKPSTKPVLSTKGLSSNWLQFKGNVSGALKATAPCEEKKRVKTKKRKPSKVVALDCEMVADENGQDMLARVSIVDFNLECIYDKFVKPTSKVVDYRTRFSGIRAQDIENGEDFAKVQQEVRALLHNKFLIGHGLRNDLNVLQFGHHLKLIRDTSMYKPFREISDGKTPSLRKLAQHFLGESIQEGEHNSIQDAAAAMKLYKKFRQEWETSLFARFNKSPKKLEIK